MSKKAYRIVVVEWVDAEAKGDIGWNDTKEMMRFAKKPCMTLHSVGYEVHNDDDHIALMGTVHSELCSAVDKIPKAFIKSITPLFPSNGGSDAERNPIKKH